VGPVTAGTAAAPVTVHACQGCGACLLTCPEHAVRPAGGRLLVRADLCTGCGECIEVCPVDAIGWTGDRAPDRSGEGAR
jgi:electron transport complex protein RnfB